MIDSISRKAYEEIGALAAQSEAIGSQLPGRENGPADAYRHILWAAEMTRRFGETKARAILEAKEQLGSTSTLRGKKRQSTQAEKMDRHNNELGVAIGKNAATWDDVKNEAQKTMGNSDRSGSGQQGNAKWLPKSEWKKNPVDDNTGLPAKPNWPNTDWKNGTVPEPYKYPYGSEKFRNKKGDMLNPIEGEIGGVPGEENPLPQGREAPPTLERTLKSPVNEWSEDDVRRVHAEAARRGVASPRGKALSGKVKEWYGHYYGNNPTPMDATGRMREPRPVRPIPAGVGPVRVRAHSRFQAGTAVQVDAYSRSRPRA